MRRAFLCICIFIGTLNANASKICVPYLAELGMPSRTADHYLNIINFLALEKGILKTHDLKTIMNSPEPVNPLAGVTVSPVESLVYQEAILKLLQNKNSDLYINWNQVKKQLGELLSQLESSSLTRQDSKVRTESVINFQQSYELPIEFSRQVESPFTLISLNHHPVLKVKLAGEETYFDLVQRQTITGMEKVENRFAASRSGLIQNSVRLGDKAIGLLRDGYSQGNSFITVITLVKSNQVTGESTDLVRFEGLGFSDFNVNYIEGHPIVSYLHSRANIGFFYDVESESTFPQVLNAGIHTWGDGNNYAAVYGTLSNMRAVIPVETGFAITDVKTGEIIKTIPANSHSHKNIRTVKTKDGEFAFVSVDESVALINLATLELSIISAPHIVSDVTEFYFQGGHYLIWGTSDGKIAVYPVSSGLTILSKKVSDGEFVQVIPFQQDGKVMALARPNRDASPIVVEITGTIK